MVESRINLHNFETQNIGLWFTLIYKTHLSFCFFEKLGYLMKGPFQIISNSKLLQTCVIRCLSESYWKWQDDCFWWICLLEKACIMICMISLAWEYYNCACLYEVILYSLLYSDICVFFIHLMADWFLQCFCL